MGTGDQDTDWSLGAITNGRRKAGMRWRAQPLAVHGVANGLLRWSSMQDPSPQPLLSPCTRGPQPATGTPAGTGSPDLPTRCPHQHSGHPRACCSPLCCGTVGAHSALWHPQLWRCTHKYPPRQGYSQGHMLPHCRPSGTCPAWPLPGPGCRLSPVWGCARSPGSASLAQSPGAAGGAVASPACSPLFPWGLIPPEGQGGSTSCSPPACGLQPGCEQVATAASPGWASPCMGLRAGQNRAGLL